MKAFVHMLKLYSVTATLLNTNYIKTKQSFFTKTHKPVKTTKRKNNNTM